eukprot:COSAG01_NODE_59868_length_297_cov_6.010101_1_plen_66_part_01
MQEYGESQGASMSRITIQLEACKLRMLPVCLLHAVCQSSRRCDAVQAGFERRGRCPPPVARRQTSA